MRAIVTVLRAGVLAGARDYYATFTWSMWLFGWVASVIAQVAFFALIGRVLHSGPETRFLLVGNATLIAGMSGVYAADTTTRERNNGTLVVLQTTPAPVGLVLLALRTYSVVEGALTSLAALLVMGAAFGEGVGWEALIPITPILLLVAMSAFCLSACLGELVLRFRDADALVTSVAVVGLMVVCGANIPLSYFPEGVRLACHLVPVTNGLEAVRGVVRGEGVGEVMVHVLFEFLVGSGWLGVAALGFRHYMLAARRADTLGSSM